MPSPTSASPGLDSRTVSRCRIVLTLWIVLLTAFRLWYAATHGLVQDEAYYWLWARRLAPGYYDQGPGIALAIRVGLLFGSSSGAVRLMAALDAALTTWLVYLLASRIFRTEAAGLAAAIFFNLVPLVFVGGILMTHDSPQVATWTAALYCLARATGIGETRDSPVGAWWIATGILAGLSIDCKFTAVLFLPCALLFLLLTARGRDCLRTHWPYMAGIVAVVVFLPPVYWNMTHHWASVRHILNLGGASKRHVFDLSATGDFLSGQLLVTLLFFFPLAWASVLAWRKGRREDDAGLLLLGCFSWPIWGMFFLLSLHGNVEANWPAPAYIPAAVAAPALCWGGFRSANPTKRTGLTVFYVASALLAVAGIVLVFFPSCLAPLAPGGHMDAWRKLDRTNEMQGWDQLAAAVATASSRPGGPWLPAAARYQDAAELAFALPDQPITFNLPITRRHNQFDIWNPLPAGASAVVALQQQSTAVYEPQLRQLFDSVTDGPEVPLWRRPLYVHPIANYQLFWCSGYHGGRNGLVPDQW